MITLRSLVRPDRLARAILCVKGALEHVEEDRVFLFSPKTTNFATKGNIEIVEETQDDGIQKSVRRRVEY